MVKKATRVLHLDTKESADKAITLYKVSGGVRVSKAGAFYEYFKEQIK